MRRRGEVGNRLVGIEGDSLEDGGKKSLRLIRELLAEEFTLDLKGALFDPADSELSPVAGACTTCPKRSANAPEFDDLVQVTNPAQGYMHNCNISPFFIMKDSPLTPEKYAAHPYLYNANTQPPHQRAGDLLSAPAPHRIHHGT